MTLLPATGFAGVIAVGVSSPVSRPAEATTGAVTGPAVAGYLALFHGRSPRAGSQPASEAPPEWSGCARRGRCLPGFGAPVILSGSATCRLRQARRHLDLARLTDHVLAHGHSVGGLALQLRGNRPDQPLAGYPLGAFIPLGVGHELTGQDSAWLFQPYLAPDGQPSCQWSLRTGGPGDPGPPAARAAAIFIAAQPALLIGYAFWGGIGGGDGAAGRDPAAGAVELARDPKPRSASRGADPSGAARSG